MPTLIQNFFHKSIVLFLCGAKCSKACRPLKPLCQKRGGQIFCVVTSLQIPLEETVTRVESCKEANLMYTNAAVGRPVHWHDIAFPAKVNK